MPSTTTKPAKTTITGIRAAVRTLNVYIKGRSTTEIACKLGDLLAYGDMHTSSSFTLTTLREAARLIGAAKGRSKRDVLAAICYRLGQLRSLEPVKAAPAIIPNLDEIEPATEQPMRLAGDCEPVEDEHDADWRSPNVVDSHIFTGPVTDLDHYEACGLV